MNLYRVIIEGYYEELWAESVEDALIIGKEIWDEKYHDDIAIKEVTASIVR